jgi:Ca2+-binding RTX toxin-like protein/RNA 3'-terminal phosphate cyclase
LDYQLGESAIAPLPVEPAVLVDYAGILPATITTITSSTANGSYGVGSPAINIQLTFSEPVVLAGGGTLVLTLSSGATVTIPAFTGLAASGSYTVVAGENSADLTVTNIALSGGTFTDLIGGANVVFPIAIGSNLGDTRAIVIDTTVPGVTLTSASPADVNGVFSVTATFDEPVVGFGVGDVNVSNGTVSNFVAVSGSMYTFDVTPSSSGVVDVNVGTGAAQDLANNSSTAATVLTRNADSAAPTLVLSTLEPINVNGAFLVTAIFNESVIDFDINDVQVTNGNVSGFSGSGDTYSFTITPAGNGAVDVSVLAGAARDAANNNSIAATLPTRIADLTPPGVTFTSAAPPDVNGAFVVTATFTEPVTGFIAGDLSVSNGTVSAFSGSGDVYTFTVTPTTSGLVTVEIPADAAQDIATNGNLLGNLTRNADLAAPTVGLTSTSPINVNGTFSVTATFNEPVINFVASDISLFNGTLSNFSGSGTTYTFDVTPIANGTVNVNVNSNVAQDIANNGNTAATVLTRTADLVAPSVLLTSTAPANVNGAFTVNAFFSETVTGFSDILTDIVVTNGAVSSLTGSGLTYSFIVTPTLSGAVTVAVPAGAAQDVANNNSNASPLPIFTRNADLVVPTVALTSAAPANVNGAFSVTATFSEAVTNFVAGDVSLTNGTISGFSGSGTTYTFNVTPTTSAPVTVGVAAGVAQDIASNLNTAAPTPITRDADLVVPTVVLSSAAPTNVNGVFSVTATFSENVSNFIASDITLTNATASNFTAVSGSVYTFDVTPISSGTVSVNLAANVAQDIANNNNTAATALTRSADLVRPTVALSSIAPANVNGVFVVTATFSETVTGFSTAGINIVNGTVNNFTPVSGNIYTFEVTPTASGTVAVNVLANGAIDIAANGNQASASLNRSADLVVPTVALTSTSPNDVNGVFTVRATFSEVVSGFTVGDIALVNGTISNFSGSGSIYTFDVTPIAGGAVTVDVAANVAQDIASNPNTAALTLTRTADLVAPTVALSSTAPANVNGTFNVTATFSEAVNNFLIGDVAVTNGTVGNFVVVSPTVYTFDITPTSSGAIAVNLPAGAAQDIANNNSTAAATLTRDADIVVPTVTLTSTAPADVKGMFSVTATFSETVFNFDATDIGISNATLSNFSGSGTTYTFDVTPTGNGAIAVDIAANAAQDIANNGNVAAVPLTRMADLVLPTVALTSAAPADVNGTFSVTATFSEAVNNFVVGDITVANATLSNFSGSGSTYTFDVTPISDGLVTVDIAANVAQDAATNDNTAAPQLTRNADITLPTVTLASIAPTDVNSPFSVTATFSEDVTNFVSGDITIANGIITNFIAVSPTEYTFDVIPVSSGVVTISVGAGAAQDIANNNNLASSPLTRNVDLVIPNVELSSTAPTNVNGVFSVTATFDEAVIDFDGSDVAIANGTISNFSGSGAVYTFDVTPTADGMVTVDIAANVAQDPAGNLNTASNQLNRTADLAPPTVSLTSVSPTDVNGLFSVTAIFSESVSNFAATGVTVTNGTVSNFSGSGTTYTFDVTPTGSGTVTVNVPANVAQDIANNNNFASVPLTREADLVAPQVELTSTAAASISATFTVTVTFSEPVLNFTDADLTVANGFVTNFSGVGNIYTFDVTPIAGGDLTIDIAAGVAQDSVGNLNLAATRFSRIVDFTPPTVELTSNAPAEVNAPFSVTATFNEEVIDFTASDITVTNGTVSDFTGSGTTYTFSVTPTAASGTVSVDIADNVATDISNNPNTAAPTLSRNIDTTPPPVPTIAPILAPGSDTGSSPQDGITNSTQPTFTGSGEAGGTVQVFSGSTSLGSVVIDPNGQWSFAPTTPLQNGQYAITFRVTDVAGNTSPASPALALTIDTVASKPLKVEITPDVRETGADGITIQFNEAVSNFDVSELTLTLDGRPVALTGATLTSSDNITWTLGNIGAQTTADGTYKLTLSQGNITDLAGNPLEIGGDETWLTGKTGTPLPPINFSGRTRSDRRGLRRKGTSKSERILGTPKNDDLWGGKGDDTLLGGFGVPLFGRDRLSGDDGDDTLIGGGGNDWLNGGKGNDRLSGGVGRDLVLGGEGDDRLLGGREDDVLVGGRGKDMLTGGSGRDTFTFSSLDEGEDMIRDFSSKEDLIDLRPIFARLPAGQSAFARYQQYVQLERSGSDVKVNIIPSGTARGNAITLAVVQNTALSDIGSRNFLIQ